MSLLRKTFGGLKFFIDRPKGTVKEWPQPDGTVRRFEYPCDYGLFQGGLLGEDEEGLDAFVGDDPNGHLESFQKLRREGSKLVPDETKFLLGVTDAERETIYRLYGLEVNARRVYDNVDQLGEALKKFEPKRKRVMKKTAYTLAELGIVSSLVGAGTGALSDPAHRGRNALIGALTAPLAATAGLVGGEEALPYGHLGNIGAVSGMLAPAAIMRAMRERPEEKSAAYLYGVKLAGIAEAFTALGRFPSSFQGSDHTEAEILKAQTETPALFATQPNLKAMQMASDPYGMGMMGGGMGGGMAPPVHHRHRHHR